MTQFLVRRLIAIAFGEMIHEDCRQRRDFKKNRAQERDQGADPRHLQAAPYQKAFSSVLLKARKPHPSPDRRARLPANARYCNALEQDLFNQVRPEVSLAAEVRRVERKAQPQSERKS